MNSITGMIARTLALGKSPSIGEQLSNLRATHENLLARLTVAQRPKALTSRERRIQIVVLV